MAWQATSFLHIILCLLRGVICQVSVIICRVRAVIGQSPANFGNSRFFRRGMIWVKNHVHTRNARNQIEWSCAEFFDAGTTPLPSPCSCFMGFLVIKQQPCPFSCHFDTVRSSGHQEVMSYRLEVIKPYKTMFFPFIIIFNSHLIQPREIHIPHSILILEPHIIHMVILILEPHKIFIPPNWRRKDGLFEDLSKFFWRLNEERCFFEVPKW